MSRDRLPAVYTRPTSQGLEALRAHVRYKTHGGYCWAAVTSDGAALCAPCCRAEYRKVYASTRYGLSDGWQIVALANSGETDDAEQCAHCNKTIWEAKS